MNGRRLKLVSLSACMALSLGLMVTGVYAATTQSYSLANSVTFTATKNVYATISYTTTGAATDVTTDKTLITYSGGTGEGSGTITPVVFPTNAADGATIVVTLKITNTSTSNPLYYTCVAPTTTGTNVTLSGETVAGKTIISTGNYANVSFTWTLTNSQLDASGTFSNGSIDLDTAEV
jgi:hypothetical protein